MIAFHVRDPETPMGTQVNVSSWWDKPVALAFPFLDPTADAVPPQVDSRRHATANCVVVRARQSLATQLARAFTTRQ